jgi:hypothetical protein
MIDSILASVKKSLGVEEDFSGFDNDILVGINSAFMALTQLGVGPEEGFSVTGSEEEWSDFLTNSTNVEGAKIYTILKTRLVFDPPANSFVTTAINEQIKELEFRLIVQTEEPIEEEAPEEE